MTNEINLSSVVLDVTMPVDMLQDYVANAVIEDRAQCDADHLAELRAYELTVAHLREQLAQRGEPVAYIRRDQLQQARRSPMLCEVTTEPRQDCVAIFTHQQAPQVPMSDAEIGAVVRAAKKNSAITRDGTTSVRVARAVEAHHGIKEKP